MALSRFCTCLLLVAFLFKNTTANQCGADLLRTPDMLERCKFIPCVTFKQELSHILDLDSSLQPFPFNCSSRSSLYARLDGAAFDILNRTPLRNSWCLYPGGCTTFEDILTFVRRSDMEGYQWVVLGLPFLLESRLSNAVVLRHLLRQDK